MQLSVVLRSSLYLLEPLLPGKLFCNPDPAKHKGKGSSMVKRELLTQQNDRHGSGKHRYQINKHASPVRPDQLDPANKEDLRKEGRAESNVEDNQPPCIVGHTSVS